MNNPLGATGELEGLTEWFAALDKWAEKPAFGTPLEEHLKRSGREIALPIEACVMLLLETGMKEEVSPSSYAVVVREGGPLPRARPLLPCPGFFRTLRHYLVCWCLSRLMWPRP